ncbi:hypothetical protein GCM10007094_23680 [Pseudovibrio japonicus]|uniref:Uncharacterized protein n=1 Tax=Pseudovibrio japonicus TaxID=366534 RepID=A0ABQ3ED54_9HYPH|nr:hypothetical protein [Pseudovibrio japonicus]GHB33979.1 hypothetical protein GCM10007094_23680 [Pseudovibrio japonicus]
MTTIENKVWRYSTANYPHIYQLEENGKRANGGYIICRLHGTEKVGNGHLIAAAPEMLRMLKQVEQSCDIIERSHPEMTWLRKVRSVIQQADRTTIAEFKGSV